MRSKIKNYKLFTALLLNILLLTQSLVSCFAQTNECTKIKFTPVASVEIPKNIGNTNNDPTFEATEAFCDLDIAASKENVLSACIHKNNSARILQINNDGTINLLSNAAVTDPVTNNDPAATRGVCALNSLGNKLFFLGNGPKEFGYDRIYSYSINTENNKNDFFVPPDLGTSVTVTPNDKFLVYLQANTSNNNLASIQSVEIKKDGSLNKSFVGQDLAKVTEAGTGANIEFVKSQNSVSSNITVGIFSNLKQGRAGSGDAFTIFRTNQITGTNKILSEYKKNSPEHPLPELFNKIGRASCRERVCQYV